MEILKRRNWEDVACPNCRSELRLHPRDIQVAKINYGFEDRLRLSDAATFSIECPVCDANITVNPPGIIQRELIKGWPKCSCEGTEHDPQDYRGQEACDWRKIYYEAPTT